MAENTVKKIATRESYGNSLKELAEEFPNLVVLDADLAAATKTGIFRKAYPDRHIDCGIAESNMMGVAAGLSLVGKIPFVSSFAMFAAGRAFEQIRNSVGYPHLNVKIGATHAGISVGEDGATHQCNEDIALMRTIPGMTIINPSDDVEAKAAVRAAYELDGPVYLRFGRLAVPVINDNDDYKFEIGKGVVLREGKDVTIVGRSNIVGKPLIHCCLNKNATVTTCHSKTQDLAQKAKEADILISAIGKANFITADMVKEKAVVIDVGINRLDNGKITGDVDFENVKEKASYITPVPGGVGPMTIAMLMNNVIKATKRQNNMID